MDGDAVKKRDKSKYYNKRLVHPTRVYKLHGMWRAEYYMPYGGVLYGDHVTWREAMDDAISASKQAAWGMKVYGTPGDVAKQCPACGADAGVYCGADLNGPTVHERRVVRP